MNWLKTVIINNTRTNDLNFAVKGGERINYYPPTFGLILLEIGGRKVKGFPDGSKIELVFTP